MRRAAVANRSQQSKALKVVKELDAFPKVPENFQEKSATGGGCMYGCTCVWQNLLIRLTLCGAPS